MPLPSTLTPSLPHVPITQGTPKDLSLLDRYLAACGLRTLSPGSAAAVAASPPIEWELEAILGRSRRVDWQGRPVSPAVLRLLTDHFDPRRPGKGDREVSRSPHCTALPHDCHEYLIPSPCPTLTPPLSRRPAAHYYPKPHLVSPPSSSSLHSSKWSSAGPPGRTSSSSDGIRHMGRSTGPSSPRPGPRPLPAGREFDAALEGDPLR